MGTFNFADSYKAAGLTANGEILRFRQQAFDTVKGKSDAQSAVTLCRLYFGISTTDTEWFRSAFHATDNSFSMIDNEREVAVLAACIIDARLEANDPFAALAILTTSFAGVRTPVVRPELVQRAEQMLLERGVDEGSSASIDADLIRAPAKSKTAAAIAGVPVNDWAKLLEVLKQISTEGTTATTSLASQVDSVVRPLIERSKKLEEEVSMLWWYIGGWSRLLSSPLETYPLASAAILAALDLADLSRNYFGPAAATPLLRKIIQNGKRDADAEVSVDEAMKGIDFRKYALLETGDAVKQNPELFPALFAVAKAAELGPETPWQAIYLKQTRIDATTKTKAISLATQAYRERLLASGLS